jgi:hypothetical protein
MVVVVMKDQPGQPDQSAQSAVPRRHRATGNPPGRPRNLARRRLVRRLLSRPDPATGRLPTFSEVADRVGVSKQRVGQLAREWGISGRREDGGLRGRRRWQRRGDGQDGQNGQSAKEAAQ